MRPTIVVPEHKTVALEDVEPTDADLRAGEVLSSRLDIRWLAQNRVELTASSHVGIVALDSMDIHIVPKHLGSDLDVLLMVEYATGISALSELEALRAFADRGTNLRDLVCLALVRECQMLLRHGLRRDYVTREDSLPVVRGRLLVHRQVVKRYGQLDLLECRFDEHDGDHLDNQLCASALDLAARTAQDPDVRTQAQIVAMEFASTCTVTRLDPLEVRSRLSYDRHNEIYRNPHRWALRLLSGGLQDLYATGGLESRTFTVNMDTLFESFVTKLARDAFAGTDVDVRAQARNRSILWNETTARPYAEVRPDLLLSRGQGASLTWRRPVDAKYKLYGDRKLGPDDTYQAFIYAHALGREPDGAPPTCCLIYPSSANDPGHRLAVRRVDGTTSATVVGVPLDLSSALTQLASDSADSLHAGFRRMVAGDL